MVFVNTQMGGMNICFPDVCKTPTPAGPVPIPYPDLASPMTAVPSCYNILMGGAPAQSLAARPTVSNGDNGGVAGGVVSSTVMGPSQTLVGSSMLILQGMPAAKMLSMTGHNGALPNGYGATLVPSQVKVMLLR